MLPSRSSTAPGKERPPGCHQPRAACPRQERPVPVPEAPHEAGGHRGLFPALLPAGDPGPAPAPRPRHGPAPAALPGTGRGGTGETPARPARGQARSGPPRPSQAPPAAAAPQPGPPQPAPLSLPYVLSWLKLANSRWPLPASPLCPAKFMAGQPSPPPSGGGRTRKHLWKAAPLSRGPRGRPDPAASPPGPCLRGGRRSGAAPAPSRPPYGQRACARAAAGSGSCCEAKQGPARPAVDGSLETRLRSPALRVPAVPGLSAATAVPSRW